LIESEVYTLIVHVKTVVGNHSTRFQHK